jgi:hypothetical protein
VHTRTHAGVHVRTTRVERTGSCPMRPAGRGQAGSPLPLPPSCPSPPPSPPALGPKCVRPESRPPPYALTARRAGAARRGAPLGPAGDAAAGPSAVQGRGLPPALAQCPHPYTITPCTPCTQTAHCTIITLYTPYTCTLITLCKPRTPPTPVRLLCLTPVHLLHLCTPYALAHSPLDSGS